MNATLDAAGAANLLSALIEPGHLTEGGLLFELNNVKYEGPARDLRVRLAYDLYGLMHAGTAAARHPDRGGHAMALGKKENQRSDLSTRLAEQYSSRRFNITRQLLSIDRDSITYSEGGLRVRASSSNVTAQREAEVDIAIVHHSGAVSPGYFYIYGRHSLNPFAMKAKDKRVYISVSNADAAYSIFVETVKYLDNASISFDAKILSDSVSYPRNDAIVLYVEDAHPHLLTAVSALLEEHRPHLTTGSSLCRYISPGLRVADEPGRDPGAELLSFGQHRCQALAHAVIDHLSRAIPLHKAIRASCLSHRIDPDDLSSNLLAGAA